MSKLDVDDEPQTGTMEKGFGTCSKCGKKTLGKSNTLCSRCGGASVESIVGYEEKTITKKLSGWEKQRKGYPARHYNNGHCPRCHAEIFVIGGKCPKCGEFPGGKP